MIQKRRPGIQAQSARVHDKNSLYKVKFPTAFNSSQSDSIVCAFLKYAYRERCYKRRPDGDHYKRLDLCFIDSLKCSINIYGEFLCEIL